jgi:hypothetical protein
LARARHGHAEIVARNTFFSIFVDGIFTTSIRAAFTKACDAARAKCVIA